MSAQAQSSTHSPLAGQSSQHNHTSLLDRFQVTTKAFVRQDSGAVAIMAALILPVLLMFAAVMMDYSNAARLRSASASALDAALLAAARQLSIGALEEDEIETYVNTFFDANIAGKGLDASSIDTVTTNYNEETGIIAGSVEATSNSVFSNILNPDGVDVGVDAEVTVSLLNVEVALVLDVTGSMGGSRIRALQTAANELVSLLMPEDGSADGLADVRISLVPYSDLVNVGPHEVAITGYASNESCVYERQDSLAFSDTPPVGAIVGTGTDDNGRVDTPPRGSGLRPAKTLITDQRNFRGYVCSNPELLPLSDDAEELSARINSFTTGGWTAGHIGVQWGWYTLSPNFDAVWPADSEPVAYTEEDTLKIMVVMTDGQFNTWYEGGQGSSFAQADGLCDAIKDEEIQIYTVGLMTSGSAESFLQDCASGPDFYYDATSQAALIEAFRNIAQMITSIRLAS